MEPPTVNDIIGLAMMIRGEVFLPGSIDYEYQVKRQHNASFHSRKPAFFAMCHDTADVQEVLKFVKTFDLPISVRSGGHSACGSSIRDGTVIVDLSPIRHVNYDTTSEQVTLGPGATLSDVNVHLLRHGRTTPVGVVPPTGCGGLVLHGGVGWLLHRYGTSTDNITEVTMVLADGTIKTVNHASEGDDRELFFAARGASSVLGVVVSFSMRTYPMDMVTGGFWMMVDDDNYTNSRELVKLAKRIVDKQEEDGNTRKLMGGVYLVNLPPMDPIPEELRNKPATLIFLASVGVDDEAMALVNKFLNREIALGAPPVVMPFNVFNQMMTGPFMTFPPLATYWKAGFLGNEIAEDVIDAFADKWVGHEPWLNASFVGMELHGGRAGREHGRAINEGNDHCVAKLRDVSFTMPIILYFPNEDEFLVKAKALAGEMDAIISDAKVAAYCNYVSELSNERDETDLGFSDVARVKAIKNKVDPDNMFNRTVILADK